MGFFFAYGILGVADALHLGPIGTSSVCITDISRRVVLHSQQELLECGLAWRAGGET